MDIIQDERREEIRKFKEKVHVKALEARSQRRFENPFTRGNSCSNDSNLIYTPPTGTCSFVLKSTARNYHGKTASKEQKEKKQKEKQDRLRLYIVLEKVNLHDEYLESLITYGIESVNDILLLNNVDFEKMGTCRKSGELLRLISLLERLGIFDQHFTTMFDYGVEKIEDINFLNSRDYSLLNIQEYSLGKLRLCAFLDQHGLFDKCYDSLDKFGIDYVKDLLDLTNEDFDHLKIGVLQRRMLVSAAIDFK
jgi:hypothetical protein